MSAIYQIRDLQIADDNFVHETRVRARETSDLLELKRIIGEEIPDENLQKSVFDQLNLHDIEARLTSDID